MRRFLVKKTGDCGSPPTTKKPKADSERLAAAREYEDRVLRIKLMSPSSSDFEPTDAIHAWNVTSLTQTKLPNV